jgi:hypothetical protein
LVISDLGYFYHGFSAAACSRYYLIAPALKGEDVSSLKQLMLTDVLPSGSDYDLSSNHWLQDLGHHPEVKGNRYLPSRARVDRDNTRVVCGYEWS